MPLARQYSATPLSMLSSFQMLSSTCTAAISVMRLRLFDLSDGHVAEPDRLDQAVALQRGQRADAGRERRARVGRMELIEMDAVDAERAPAGLARGGEMARASVGDPGAVRTRQAAFGRHPDARAVAVPAAERASDQALVVTGLAGIPAVGVRGVEEIDAGIEGRVQHGQRARLVAIALRGEAHAAHADNHR